MTYARRRRVSRRFHPLWWFTVAVWIVLCAAVFVFTPLAGPLQVLLCVALGVVLAVVTDSRLNRYAEMQRRRRRSA